MNEPRREIIEDRDLTSAEVEVIRWLLENGKPEAGRYLPELGRLRVVARCGCGCASVDFVSTAGALEVLSDHQWEDDEGHLFGIFVFAKRGALAGLEVWSIDGQADTPSSLPSTSSLRALA